MLWITRISEIIKTLSRQAARRSLSDEIFVENSALAPSLVGPKSRAVLMSFSCPEDTGSGISCSCHLGRVRRGILLMGSKGKWQCLVLRGGNDASDH